MSSDRDTTRVVRSWLEDGVTTLPDRVLDDVLDQVPATPQRRPWWPVLRHADMNTIARFAIVAATAVLVAVIGSNLLPAGGEGGGSPATSPSDSQPATPPPSPAPMPADVLPDNVVFNSGAGRYSVAVQGVPLSFNFPAAGWESHGRPYISKSFFGPQGAEAIIFWASFPDSLSADLCTDVLSPSIAPSTTDLAAAVSTAPGTELVTGPTDVTVGGRAAKHLVVIVRGGEEGQLGCQPGWFYYWDPFDMGAMWLETQPGDTIRVWIVDVDGTLIFIAGTTREDVGQRVEQEIQQVVDSIQFE